MGTLIVAGLGPGGPELITAAVREAIDRTSRRFVRTRRHPVAAAVAPAESFDSIYQRADSLEEVYPAIVDRLVAEVATGPGDVLYAVPGSPLVAERTVELLRAVSGLALEVLAGMSFADLAWTRLGVDPVAAGVRLVDGRRFGVEAAGERGPLLVAQCDTTPVLSDIKLAALAALDRAPAGATNPPVTVLQRLGLPDEKVFEVAWADLDQAVTPDHLTTLFVPELGAPIAREVARFADLALELRRRCPWDQEQTHQSLRGHLLEETYEVLEALDGVDPDTAVGYEQLEEELGDLLYQIVFHSVLAAEAGQFTLADVAQGIHDKLKARHPHVFGPSADGTSSFVSGSADEGAPDGAPADADSVLVNWEAIKREQKGRTSVMDGIPTGLPALLLADKVMHKARSVGVVPDVDTTTVAGRLYDAVVTAQADGLDAESELRVLVNAIGDQIRAREQG
ncbi:MazG nucleotide pyrophosphohydrolase domain-containing protein [Candidatus Poriferisocius sp.]|uniref:MazG nucleotide pyrophosphohydrolase domain-containing protein n=1 Tax=Candidatus Poriferisocius sp. TaxID=3101276 RepID=UPI003B5C8D21